MIAHLAEHHQLRVCIAVHAQGIKLVEQYAFTAMHLDVSVLQ
jgi:hypothetical protein